MRPVLTFRESFLREMLLSYRSAKVFSLKNSPLYGIIKGSGVQNMDGAGGGGQKRGGPNLSLISAYLS